MTTKNFNVNVGSTRRNPLQHRVIWFETIEQARAFCNEVFSKTGIVLSIERKQQ